MKALVDAINIFYKEASFIKRATLLSDMAHRTMFGLLPNDKFDFIAARWAAKGAPDIIYYGTKSVVEELVHYKGNLPPIHAPHKLNPDNYDEYIKVLSECKKIYNNKKNWDTGFGGPTWADIASSLINIVNSYKYYKETINDSPEQERAIKKLLNDINIFDGLAHNSGSVYNKMVRHEGRSNQSINQAQELKDIIRLRDMSESNNKFDILKELYPHLYPKLPYQDQISKMKQNPEFFEPQGDRVEKHLEEVRKRKMTKIFIVDFIHSLEKDVEVVNDIIHEFVNLVNILKRSRGKLLKDKNMLNEYYMKIKNIENEIANPNVGIIKNIPINWLKREQSIIEKIVGTSISDYLDRIVAQKIFISQIINSATVNASENIKNITNFPLTDNDINNLIETFSKFINSTTKAIAEFNDIIKIIINIKRMM